MAVSWCGIAVGNGGQGWSGDQPKGFWWRGGSVRGLVGPTVVVVVWKVVREAMTRGREDAGQGKHAGRVSDRSGLVGADKG